jgi:hypothetical protein
MVVYPVIHHKTDDLTILNAKLAFKCGCPGVFVISHNGKDVQVVDIATKIKRDFPDKRVGINLLSRRAIIALYTGLAYKLDMTWTDFPGLTSQIISEEARTISKSLSENPGHQFFGSIAFKYQTEEQDPGGAAANAAELGMIPTTSGEATGVAPSLEKLDAIRYTLGVMKNLHITARTRLALASGITPENLAAYAPYLSHVLVATGISEDFHHFSPKKLFALMEVVEGI